MALDDSALVAAIADMDEDVALELARGALNDGCEPQHILDLCRAAMDIVGARFEQGEYFLPELMMAGEMLEQIGAMVKPLMLAGEADAAASAGPVVMIGTVHGDLHDIGKNIVTFMLEVNGFKVVDLGIDVPVKTFIDKIKEHQPVVVGLSGFLTLAFDSMKETVDAIAAAGLRDSLKIMIGGGQVDETVRAYTGADAFGLNAMAAVSLCQEWLGRAKAA
ncbi:methionine synthase [Paramagnetospirillum caucaseum]|uniref:Methionine synthase n=1 Tax=Paramagnetospirillum caucaseum TaxID=1244869 RepID=M2Y9E1_9PROT|nr:cobalamin-dependent protein [Paramagnetospirillum caucaseum]EME69621.1 methionine synthase [Paramagnetospirillum caucaseum]